MLGDTVMNNTDRALISQNYHLYPLRHSPIHVFYQTVPLRTIMFIGSAN